MYLVLVKPMKHVACIRTAGSVVLEYDPAYQGSLCQSVRKRRMTCVYILYIVGSLAFLTGSLVGLLMHLGYL